MKLNKKITLAVLACASPFFTTGCSDSPTNKELREINEIPLDKNLVNKGVTNPKTLYIKDSGTKTETDKSDLVVTSHKAPAVVVKKTMIDAPIVSIVSASSVQISKLTKQRDEAVILNENLKKDISTKAVELNDEIQVLKQDLNKKDTLDQGKLKSLNTQVESSKELISDKDEEIKKIQLERDEAIALTLSLKKDIDAKTLDLNQEIQGLKQNYDKKELLTQDKLKAVAVTLATTKALTANTESKIEKINLERDASLKKADLLEVDIEKLTKELDDSKNLVDTKVDIINGLKHERDDAVSLSLDLKKEIQTLKQNYSEQDVSAQAEINLFDKEIERLKKELEDKQNIADNSKDLVTNKINIIENLKNERDEAVALALDIKKDIDANTLDLSKEIQTLKQDYSDKDASAQAQVDLLDKEIERLKKELEDKQNLVDNSKDLVTNKIDIIESLKHERDEAVALALDIKKDIDANTLDLNKEIQTLKQDYSDKDASAQAQVDLLDKEIERLKKELVDKQSLVDNSKDLVTNKINIIENLKIERDEAVSLTLSLKKDIDAKTLDLNSNIQTLKQDYSVKDASAQAKVDLLSKDIEKLKQELDNSQKLAGNSKDLVANKVDIINTLKQERDEAVSLTLSLKKDIDAKTLDLNSSIYTLKQNYSAKDASAQEKLKSLNLELKSAKELTVSKDEEIQKIKTDLDKALSITVNMKKEATELNQDIQSLRQANTQKDSLTQEKIKTLTVDLAKSKELIAQTESTSKEKIAVAIASLAAVKQLAAKGDSEIESLKVKISQSENALDKERSVRQDAETKILKERKDFVNQNIMSTFELSKVEFKTGSSILTKESTKLLDKVATIMKKHSSYQYKIQGHTDSSGKEDSNLKLSENRSISVKDYLVSKGVDSNILSSQGFGSSNPIADNATSKGRSANRRVVFEILD